MIMCIMSEPWTSYTDLLIDNNAPPSQTPQWQRQHNNRSPQPWHNTTYSSVAQKEAIKDSRKKSSDAILRDAVAIKIDRENMKRSLSQKRNREEAFTEISDSDSETDEFGDSDLVLLQSTPATSQKSSKVAHPLYNVRDQHRHKGSQ